MRVSSLPRLTFFQLAAALWALAGCGVDARDVEVATPGINAFPPDSTSGQQYSLGDAGGGDVVRGDAGGQRPIAAVGDVGLSIEPSRLDFAQVAVGAEQAESLHLTNSSAEATAIEAPTLVGAPAGVFRVEGGTCGAALGPSESCELGVVFAPPAAGEYAASLTLGSSVPVALSGVGVSPSVPRLTAEGGVADLGSVSLGSSSARSLTLENPGGSDLDIASITISGSADFELLQPVAGDCSLGSSVLPPGATCTVRVSFTASAVGPVSAIVTVTTSGDQSATLEVSASGLGSANLQSNPLALEFTETEVNVVGSTLIWSIQNTGQANSGALTLLSTNAAEFGVQGSCTELAPGQTCNLSVTFTPRAGGVRSGSLSLVNAAGAGLSTSVSGRGQFRLTINRTGAGVVSAPNLDCGARCSALFDAGTIINLQARTDNGTSSFFSGWSDPRCIGPNRACNVTLTESTSISATFRALTTNIAFGSSDLVEADLGGALGYDRHCNSLASTAGINNAAGDAFVALVSDSTSSVSNRLGSARGWVRLDGRPYFDTLGDLTRTPFESRVMYFPMRFDEFGRDLYTSRDAVLTGIETTGESSTENCNNWTSVSVDLSMRVGNFDGGPLLWTGGQYPCSIPSRIICLGKTQAATLSVTVTTGRRIWVTDTPYLPGSMTPEAKCQLERPSGVAQARPVVATSTRAANAVLTSTTNYVRPDGQLVGTGAQLAALDPQTWPWLTNTGRAIDVALWTGSATMTQAGTRETTCNDWTSTVGTAPNGLTESYFFFWTFFPSECSVDYAHLLCVDGG